MRLLELRLENFRSFASPEVVLPFEPGLNLLTGPNGAGKTSVLEAIGQCLFLLGGDSPGPQRFQGGPWRMALRFLAPDRSAYCVLREEKTCELYREAGEELLASTPEGVGETLRDLLDLDREAPPGELFQQVLCGRQGEYGRDLVRGEKTRRRLFDPLFKVDRFKHLDQVLEPLSPEGRLIRQVVAPLEEEARDLRQRSARLPETEARRELLEQEVEARRLRLEETEAELRHVRGLLEAQLDRAAELRRLHQEMTLSRQTQEAKQEQLETAQGRLEEAQVARIRREACRPDAERYQRARKELKELEGRKQEWKRHRGGLRQVEDERDRLLETVATLTRSREERLERIHSDRRRLETMRDELARLGDRVEQFDEHGHRKETALERARSHLAQAGEELQSIRQSVRELRQLEESASDRRGEQERLQERARLALANPEEQGRLPQLSDGLLRLRHQHSMILGKIELLETERVLLTSGQCPFVSRDCPGLPGTTPGEALEQKLEELNRERYLRDQEIEEYENWLRKAEKAELTRSEGEAAARRARELGEEIEAGEARIRERLEELSLAQVASSLLETSALLDQVEGTPSPDLRKRIEKLRSTAIHSVTRATAPMDLAAGLVDDLRERVRKVQEVQLKDRSLRDETREENARLDEQVRRLQTDLEAAEREHRRDSDLLEENERRLASRDAELEALLVRVAPFRNLPEEEARLQEVCAATESEYHAWIRLESEALDEENRQNLVASLERENTLLREAREQLERRLALASQEVGTQEEITRLEDRRDALTAEESRLGNELGHDQEQLEELCEELARMQEENQRAEALEGQVAGYQRASRLVTRLRRVFQRAAPELAGRYLEQVSREASRSYRALEPREPGEICWERDYRVSLRGRLQGPEGPLDQPFSSLSGGDKVSVALSLRLALARVLSPLSLLFLDEPTAHLDAEHRSRLAHHLHRASRELGFDQLVVITHGPGFEGVPHHRIALENRGGRSRLLS